MKQTKKSMEWFNLYLVTNGFLNVLLFWGCNSRELEYVTQAHEFEKTNSYITGSSRWTSWNWEIKRTRNLPHVHCDSNIAKAIHTSPLSLFRVNHDIRSSRGSKVRALLLLLHLHSERKFFRAFFDCTTSLYTTVLLLEPDDIGSFT